MEAVVLWPRFFHRVSVLFLWICLVLFGCLKESNAQTTFLEEPQDTAVVLGQSVFLNCTAKASVKIYKYTWQFEGSKIVPDKRVVIESDGTLRITKTQEGDSGEYVCVAITYPGGKRTKKKSRKAILTVQSICSASNIVKSPKENLYAVNRNLNLECACSGNPTPSVVWNKDGKPVTLGGRLRTSGSTLTITKLEIADSGSYECNATNVLGSKKSPAANIKVIKTVDPVFDQKPKDQYYAKIGQDLSLPCKASGKPKPTISWYYSTLKDALGNSSKHTLTNDGSLFIINVESSDFAEYKCKAKNIVNSKTTVTKISEAYINNVKLSSPTYVNVGSKLSIVCKPPGGPNPVVTWERTGGGSLPASYTDNKGILENSNVKITDSGNFTCVAKNIAGTKSGKVRVIASVFPIITSQPKDTLANENSKVKLECTVKSSPVSKVSWSVDNQAVKLDSNHKINSNNALVFKKISLSDAGQYRCTVSHPGTTVFSREANVTVREAVRLKDSSSNRHKFDRGSTAELYCSFKGSGPISVKWEKVGTKELAKNMVVKDGNLFINHIDMQHGGLYKCTGYNLFSNFSAHLNISVFIYPKFVVKPKNTTAVEFDSVWLHCNATGFPKPKINWGKEEHGGDVLDGERFHVMKNGTLFIENIRAKDQGRYYCIAGNTGSFKQVTISLRVVSSPGTAGKSKTSAMGRTIAIAVGCAAAYIILVVGLMIYCKRRRAKQQKKEELALPIEGDIDNCEANPEIALQPINGKPANYNKMEFPRHDLEALRTLGNGSYGRAFLARASGIKDGERETMVVVKSLMSKDDIQKEDFWRELNALVNMDNPHVVALLGVCRDIDPTYMIFESLEKGDLKQYLLSCYENGRSTLTSSQKLSLCSNLVSGMTYLASNKFVHKDVAARNCMVSKDSQVKIGFLSLSYDLYSSEYYRFNNILIPLRWMAPEAIFNDDFTEKSDVWSFGVLVWELYTLGQTPFEGRSDEEVLKCIKDDLRLTKPDNCPDSMANMMVKCWEENPEDRPSFDKLYSEISEIAVDTHL